MTKRVIDVRGVELCTESFGDPDQRPILLIQGVAASMLWWDEGFCRKLANSRRFISAATSDRSDRESVVQYVVDYCRVLAGPLRPFDEARMRDLVRRDVERARDFAASRNHELLAEGQSPHEPLSSISAPTLVIHGTRTRCSPSSTA